jgi:hypothetical protein
VYTHARWTTHGLPIATISVGQPGEVRKLHASQNAQTEVMLLAVMSRAHMQRRSPLDVITRDRLSVFQTSFDDIPTPRACMRNVRLYAGPFARPDRSRLCSVHPTRKIRTLSSRRVFTSSVIMSQKAEVLGSEEYKTDAKWLKLENIKWKDQSGKEVGVYRVSAQCGTDRSAIGRSQIGQIGPRLA